MANENPAIENVRKIATPTQKESFQKSETTKPKQGQQSDSCPKEKKKESQRERILNYMKGKKECTIKEMTEALKLNPNSVAGTCSVQHLKAKTITKVRVGCYRLKE